MLINKTDTIKCVFWAFVTVILIVVTFILVPISSSYPYLYTFDESDFSLSIPYNSLNINRKTIYSAEKSLNNNIFLISSTGVAQINVELSKDIKNPITYSPPINLSLPFSNISTWCETSSPTQELYIFDSKLNFVILNVQSNLISIGTLNSSLPPIFHSFECTYSLTYDSFVFVSVENPGIGADYQISAYHVQLSNMKNVIENTAYLNNRTWSITSKDSVNYAANLKFPLYSIDTTISPIDVFYGSAYGFVFALFPKSSTDIESEWKFKTLTKRNPKILNSVFVSSTNLDPKTKEIYVSSTGNICGTLHNTSIWINKPSENIPAQPQSISHSSTMGHLLISDSDTNNAIFFVNKIHEIDALYFSAKFVHCPPFLKSFDSNVIWSLLSTQDFDNQHYNFNGNMTSSFWMLSNSKKEQPMNFPIFRNQTKSISPYDLRIESPYFFSSESLMTSGQYPADSQNSQKACSSQNQNTLPLQVTPSYRPISSSFIDNQFATSLCLTDKNNYILQTHKKMMSCPSENLLIFYLIAVIFSWTALFLIFFEIWPVSVGLDYMFISAFQSVYISLSQGNVDASGNDKDDNIKNISPRDNHKHEESIIMNSNMENEMEITEDIFLQINGIQVFAKPISWFSLQIISILVISAISMYQVSSFIFTPKFPWSIFLVPIQTGSFVVSGQFSFLSPNLSTFVFVLNTVLFSFIAQGFSIVAFAHAIWNGSGSRERKPTKCVSTILAIWHLCTKYCVKCMKPSKKTRSRFYRLVWFILYFITHILILPIVNSALTKLCCAFISDNQYNYGLNPYQALNSGDTAPPSCYTSPFNFFLALFYVFAWIPTSLVIQLYNTIAFPVFSECMRRPSYTTIPTLAAIFSSVLIHFPLAGKAISQAIAIFIIYSIVLTYKVKFPGSTIWAINIFDSTMIFGVVWNSFCSFLALWINDNQSIASGLILILGWCSILIFLGLKLFWFPPPLTVEYKCPESMLILSEHGKNDPNMEKDIAGRPMNSTHKKLTKLFRLGEIRKHGLKRIAPRYFISSLSIDENGIMRRDFDHLGSVDTQLLSAESLDDI